jgi:hypothetical protein
MENAAKLSTGSSFSQGLSILRDCWQSILMIFAANAPPDFMKDRS